MDKVENILKNLLQRSITITLKNRVLKKGKLLIFRDIGHYIRLDLDSGFKREHIEIPYPFDVEEHIDDKVVLLDYRLVALTDNDGSALSTLQAKKPVKECKFYDSILCIEIIDAN